MEIAGKLMEKGFDFNELLDQTFFQKTYLQNQILGRALLESMLLMDGKCIISALRKKDLDFYGVDQRGSGRHRQPAAEHHRRGSGHFPL